jgi:FlaA1/EpsC-like NDP-sugar epimerase
MPLTKNFYGYLLNLSRRNKMAIQVLADGVAIVMSFFAAMWLRLDSLLFATNPVIWIPLIPALITALAVLQSLGFYRAVIRYIVVRALKSVVLAAFASSVMLAVIAQTLRLPIPVSVPVIYGILFFLSVGLSRFVFREAAYQTQSYRKERVVIYGAGAAGRQLVQTLRQGTDYLPIAFLDDDPRTHGTMVAGFRVHPREKIDQLIRNNSVTSVLLAIPSATKLRRSAILKWLEQYPLHVRSVPGLHDIATGVARIDDLNEIALEDLLNRQPVTPDDRLLGANITGKTVLVTGAAGSIGSELCRQILRQRPQRLILIDISEPALYAIEQELLQLRTRDKQTFEIVAILGSVQNRALVERTMRRFGVQTVYHAAAYKHVPLVEHNIGEGIRNNVLGTKVAVEAAIACGAEAFILVSTDKAVRPTNVMGASKRLAELVCQALADAPHVKTRISMVRFGNVLGSSGSVIPLFRRQIAAGGPITVTHPEITRFFMTIPEAAQLVIQAGAMAQGGDVFLLNMGEPVRIAELAAQMARLHGLKAVFLTDGAPVGPGEIGIVFTRLRPGEKLHEELLIGDGAEATAHPRILTTTERHLPLSEVIRTLEQLDAACSRCDIAAIRRLLVEAQTGYQPQRDIVDHFYSETLDGEDAPDGRSQTPDTKRLTLVSGGSAGN